MSGPYPTISRWLVPASALASTLAGVRPAGARGLEAGAFWLGERKEIAEVSAVLLPAGKGVVESPYQWKVEPEVFGNAISWAKPRGLTLLAIVHTHVQGVPPKLSWADRYLSIQVPGILSVIIGNGGRDMDPAIWGWYVHDGGDYQQLSLQRLRSQVSFADGVTIPVLKVSALGVEEVK